jgi:predicted phosphodiesterase
MATQKKPQTILIASDVHIPEHDRRAWKALLLLAKDLRPDYVVLAGDFLELHSVSQHGAFNREMLNEDLAHGRQALEAIKTAAPKAKIVYLEGNHETRLPRYLATKAPSLEGTLDLQKGLKLKEYGITWVTETQQPWSKGRLDVIHGHQMGMGPKHHAMRMADLYGAPNRVVVYGHTHKPQLFTAPGLGGNKTALGLGCLRTLQPGWLHGANAGWGHGFAVAELSASGRAAVYPVPVVDGYIYWHGKTYDGR